MPTYRELQTALVALERGLITGKQLDEALALGEVEPSTPLLSILVRKGWIDAPAREEIEAAQARPGPLDADEAETDAATVGDGGSSAFAAAGDSADGGPETVEATVPSAGDRSWGAVVAEETVAMATGSPPSAGPPSAEDTCVGSVGMLPSALDTETAEASSSPEDHVLLGKIAGADPVSRDRYTRTRLHAKGGIGQVWLARDTSLGREVALKELRGDRVASPATWARFLEEARITGQLEHPGIVPIYELTRRPGDHAPFYTMRFIRGRTLSEAIQAYHEKRKRGEAGPLERADLLEAFVSVCNAVAYAHSRGVVHRDLKGQNVVLGDFGEVMVLDWGLAKVVGRPAGETRADGPAVEPVADNPDRRATMVGQVQGTPAYMAPEQAAGRVGEIGPHTDIYSLGAILYEILAAQPPFQSTTTKDLLHRVIYDAPRPPSATDPSVPRALEAVALKALEKQPEQRYPSAELLALDVKRWLADEPVSVYREPWTRCLSRWARRHRTAVASAAALLVTGFVALSVSSVLIRRERDEARAQRQQARLAVDDMYSKVADQWLEDRLDPLQREFLSKALAYYENFTRQDAADPTLRQEQGRAYQRMADVLRKLGRHDEAEPAYRRSIDILDRLAKGEPKVAGHRRHLASALSRLAGSLTERGRYPEAEPLYRRSIELSRALADASADPADRVALASAELGLGDLLRVNGQQKQAEEAFRRSAELLKPLAGAGGVEARQGLAAAFDNLGLLLRETGRFEEAAASYRRAAELLEKLVAEAPTMPGPRDGLAKVYNSLGLLIGESGLAEESEDVLRRQVALQQRLNDDFPDRPNYRRALSRALLNLAIRLDQKGEAKEAEALYRKALALNDALATDFPDVVKYRRDQARCLNDLGVLLAAAGRPDDAEALYNKALAIYRRLADESPTVPDYRNTLAGTLMNRGQLLGATRRRLQAEESYREALAFLDALTSEHPDNPDYQRNAAKCLDSLGNALVSAGRRKDAEGEYRRAAELYEKLVARKDSRPADRLALATCLSNRGDNLRAGKIAGAEPVFRRSLGLSSALVAEAPKTPAYRRALAVGHLNFGEFLAQTDRRRDAEKAYQSSIDLYETLSADFPSEPGYKSEHGYALGDLAGLLLDEKRTSEACPVLERAIAAQRAATGLNPRSAGYRHMLRGHLAALAGALIDLGEHTEASRVAEDLVRSCPDLSGVRAQAARLLTRCVALGKADIRLLASQRDELAGSYADRAIALIRAAIDRRETGADRLLDAAEFAPLKFRESFKSLAVVVPTKETGLENGIGPR
jgi:serine/threonine-protein kinase